MVTFQTFTVGVKDSRRMANEKEEGGGNLNKCKLIHLADAIVTDSDRWCNRQEPDTPNGTFAKSFEFISSIYLVNGKHWNIGVKCGRWRDKISGCHIQSRLVRFLTASFARSRQLESPIAAGGNVSPCRGWPRCVPMFNWTLAKASQE